MELDSAQRNAVSHMGGPLRVKAGPGSGKTHVIVERVAKLVSSGVEPESILCMTFTEKAADVMRRRLQEKEAANVWVGTIHALCLEILKDNSITTGISDETIVFSEMAGLVWCVWNIDKFGIDTDVIDLSRGVENKSLNMLKAIRLAKREMITADDLEEYVQSRDDLPQLKELLKIYRAYEEYKKEKDLIDYEDMVVMAVRYLQQNTELLERYRERFRHVLIDEFQDNNYAQFVLADLLADRNIMVVGDEDQSIMGFQGAFGGIFEEFAGTYKDQTSLTLERNYRCSGNISALSGELLRADPDIEPKELFTENDDGDPIKVVAASNEEAERRFVAEEITKLDIPYREIAILCKTNRECQKFAETLRGSGIPATLAHVGDITRNSMVAEIMSLLKIADSPQTSGREISHILKIGGIHEYNIRDLNGRARDHQDEVVDGVFSALESYSGSDQNVEIQEIKGRLQELVDYAKSGTLLDTLHRIMNEYTDSYRKNANSDEYDAARNLTLLNKLYNIAEDYTNHYDDKRLSDFIEYLGFAEYADIGTMDAEYADTVDAVNIMTIHKSKGKEFQVVFVTGLYDGGLPGKYRPDKFEIPPELLQGKGRIRDPERAHVLEQRRLLYVAMTRAKKVLYMTYPRQVGDSKKERSQSAFLDDLECLNNPRMLSAQYTRITQNGLPPKDELEAEKFRIQEDACKAIRESRPEAAIRNIIHMAKISHVQKSGTGDDFDPSALLDVNADGMDIPPMPRIRLLNSESLTLSATDIDTYQKCPLQFKYRKILKVPEGPISIYLKKGSAVHGAIQKLSIYELKKQKPDVEKIKDGAKKYMDAVRYRYDRQTFEGHYTSVEESIDQYIKWNDVSTNNLEGSEVKFDIVIDGITYRGKIDRIETDADGNYIVIDFKTGSSIITKKDVMIHPQTNIYAAAIREKYGVLPVRVSLYYLEKDRSRDYMVDEESLKAGLDIVQECARNIVQENFDATPGYAVCKFCSYTHICPSAVSTY